MRLKATLLEYSKSTTKQIPSSAPGAAIPSDGGIINGLHGLLYFVFPNANGKVSRGMKNPTTNGHP